jgi:hypothetical protein
LGDIARSKNQDRSAAAVAQAQSGEPKDTDLLMLQRNREDGGNLSYYYLAPVQPETNQNVNIRLGARVYQNQPNRELQQNRSRAQAQRSMHLPTLKAGVQTSTQIGEATTLFAELASETKLADVILTVDAPKSIEFLAGNRAAKGSVTIWSGSLLPQKVQRASTRIRASHNGPQQITLTLLRNREEIVAQQTFLFSVGQQISSPAASPAASKR